jgi:methionyl-tRNA formyltransferase
LRPGRLQNDLIEGIPAELLKAPLLKSKKVDLSSSAEKVYHLMRAFMTPKFHFHAKGNDIIIKVSDEYLDGEGEVGTFQVSGKKLFLRCGDRFIRVSGWY